jgi:cell division septal protein FtsQ
MGSNLWQFDAALFTRNITNLNPLIKEVEIKKIFPSKIEINFIKRTPFAEVVDANGRQILVDKQGKLYASATAEGLTKIYIMESISVGEDAASILLLKALEILKLLEGSFIPAESINIISDESIKVKLFDNFQVWLSPNKDLNKQVDALHLILQNSKMIEGEETITEVDLRYESPVVR